MKAIEFLSIFPAIKRDQSTGGGCTAWEMELPRGAYVLITDGIDACQPELKAKRAMFSVCHDCTGEDEPHTFTWAQAVPWMRGVLEAAKNIEAARHERTLSQLTIDEQFFYQHAGYSWKSPETKEDGRRRTARKLAEAEARARDEGHTFQWREDELDSSEWSDERPPYSQWLCMMRDAAGHGVVGSLGCIDFGRDGEPWGDAYKRVVEAELALEHLP